MQIITPSGERPPKLSQTRGILRIDSEIRPDGIWHRQRSFLSSREEITLFHEVGKDVLRVFHVPRLYLFITLFFAAALGLRIFRFLTTENVSALSLAWSAFLFLLPLYGTWMQSPRYVGHLTSRGALLFFDKGGDQDPTPYLSAIQQARDRYLETMMGRVAAHGEHDTSREGFEVH